MVFWNSLKKKIKDSISRKEFNTLKQSVEQNTDEITDLQTTTTDLVNKVNQNTEDIVFCAKTTQNNQFYEVNTFNGTTNLTFASLTNGTIANEPINENDIVNKKYVDNKAGGTKIKVYESNDVVFTKRENNYYGLTIFVDGDVYEDIPYTMLSGKLYSLVLWYSYSTTNDDPLPFDYETDSFVCGSGQIDYYDGTYFKWNIGVRLQVDASLEKFYEVGINWEQNPDFKKIRFKAVLTVSE